MAVARGEITPNAECTHGCPVLTCPWDGQIILQSCVCRHRPLDLRRPWRTVTLYIVPAVHHLLRVHSSFRPSSRPVALPPVPPALLLQVLTMEWVRGAKFTDKQAVHGLGLRYRDVTQTLVEVFADQIFGSGFVHCDPHPGNLLVCKGPDGRHRLCVLDHGLYIEEPSSFRLQYCQLWEAIFMLDTARLTKICTDWGIHDAEFFASLQLFRPFRQDKIQQVDALLRP